MVVEGSWYDETGEEQLTKTKSWSAKEVKDIIETLEKDQSVQMRKMIEAIMKMQGQLSRIEKALGIKA